MIRKILTVLFVFALLFSAGQGISAPDQKSSGKTQDEAYKDSPEYEKLMKDKKDTILKMYDLRVKLISEDPAISKLHKQIMALHRELAIEIDSRKDMRKLIEKSKTIDQDIEKLAKRKNYND